MNRKFVSALDAKTGLVTKNFISIPVILNNSVRGGIIVTNKIRVRDDSHQHSRGCLHQNYTASLSD